MKYHKLDGINKNKGKLIPIDDPSENEEKLDKKKASISRKKKKEISIDSKKAMEHILTQFYTARERGEMAAEVVMWLTISQFKEIIKELSLVDIHITPQILERVIYDIKKYRLIIFEVK